MKEIMIILNILILILLVKGWVFIITHKWTELELNLVFYLTVLLNISKNEAMSLIRGITYCIYGLLTSLSMVFYFNIPTTSLLTINREMMLFTILGSFCEVSLVRWITLLFSIFWQSRGVNIPKAINDVRWIRGIFKLPPKLVPVMIISAAFIEEFFFRYTVLMALLNFGISPTLSLLMSIIMFVYEQLSMLTTRIQKIIIGVGSIVISIIGGMLVLALNAPWPAMIAHASFVLFYMGESSADIWWNSQAMY